MRSLKSTWNTGSRPTRTRSSSSKVLTIFTKQTKAIRSPNLTTFISPNYCHRFFNLNKPQKNSAKRSSSTCWGNCDHKRLTRSSWSSTSKLWKGKRSSWMNLKLSPKKWTVSRKSSTISFWGKSTSSSITILTACRKSQPIPRKTTNSTKTESSTSTRKSSPKVIRISWSKSKWNSKNVPSTSKITSSSTKINPTSPKSRKTSTSYSYASSTKSCLSTLRTSRWKSRKSANRFKPSIIKWKKMLNTPCIPITCLRSFIMIRAYIKGNKSSKSQAKLGPRIGKMAVISLWITAKNIMNNLLGPVWNSFRTSFLALWANTNGNLVSLSTPFKNAETIAKNHNKAWSAMEELTLKAPGKNLPSKSSQSKAWTCIKPSTFTKNSSTKILKQSNNNWLNWSNHSQTKNLSRETTWLKCK